MLTLNDIQEQWKKLTNGRQYPILTKQKRGISGAENILNRMHHGQTLMICHDCTDSRTLKNRGYTELRRFHCGDAKCDGCQEFTSLGMWLFAEHRWAKDLRQEKQLDEVRRRDQQNSTRFRS